MLILLLGRVVWGCFAFLWLLWDPCIGPQMLGTFVSYLDVLILFEHWLGHRLLSEKVTRMHLRANRPF